MKRSPFPGYDPYLEGNWGDVHTSLVLYCRDALQAQLPGDLRSRAEERVYLLDEDVERQIIPDVVVTEKSWTDNPRAGQSEAGGAAVAEPLVVDACLDPITERFVEIRERSGGRLVTVIEFLSPTNRQPGLGRDKYLEKQDQLLRSPVSLVEIDFIRAGIYSLAAPRDSVPDPWVREPLACITLGWQRHRHELYHFSLQRRLPLLAIPLRRGEKRVLLDLQGLLDQAWSAGRYDDIDYSQPPEPPLYGAHAAWATEMIAAAGKE